MKISGVTVLLLWVMYFGCMIITQYYQGLIFSTVYAAINIAAILFTLIWIIQLIAKKKTKTEE
ncbi:MAG: hypothetical protein WCP14_03240 [bacterium]